ncbi:SGNH/GDSL hydrolase family protein [Kribbella sp. NPDC003505]|uniref:SGNH/GDSL hydrolase family protein n=1 Tax=Kribbella sp. NPDC003505 TaxID=3154448 RepID=UPI0033A051B4
MNLKRAGAAFTTATALTLGIATPTTAVYLPRPRINYGSGYWGGPLGAPNETGDPTTADIAIFGDSITSRCRADLTTALTAKGHTVYTWSWSGQNTRGIAAAIRSAEHLPSRVIVEAGTNDLFDPPAARSPITQLAADLTAAGTDWRWVDTYVRRPATATADTRNSGQVNSYIHAAAGESRVVRWADALTAAQNRGRALSYYLQDGVHPWTAAGTGHADGCAFLAAVVAQAVPGAPQ